MKTRIGPPPPFDSELETELRKIEAYLPRVDSLDDIPAAREIAAGWAQEDLTLGGLFEVRDVEVPGPQGSPAISLLICRPADATQKVPVLYYTHGGGMVLGSNRFEAGCLLRMADALGAGYVAVEYRLAPETPFPGPQEDCYAGLLWVAEHADEIGFDRSRIVVAGTSAGGGLAASTCLLARDRGTPAVRAQVLMCPMLDDRNDTVSAIQMEGLGVWDRPQNIVGWTALLGDKRGTADVSPYEAPARAEDLSGLPPTLIDVGSAETFRDEAVAYAGKIWRSGGVCELHVWPGAYHGYDSIAPDAAMSRDASDVRLRWLKRTLDFGGTAIARG